MGTTIYIAIAVVLGVSLSLQPSINAVMSRTVGSPLMSASISIAISLLLAVLIWLTLGKGEGDLSRIRVLPWWIVIGGVIGTVFVVGSLIVAPVLGLALFFVCVVAGQLLGSTIADQFGAFGMQVKEVNSLKLLGLGLVLAGAALVQVSSR